MQNWLRRTEHPVEDASALPPDFDMTKRREAMFAALRGLPEQSLENAHLRWSAPGYLDGFVAEVYARLREGIGARWKPAYLGAIIDTVIRTQVFDLRPQAAQVGGTVVALELERICKVATTRMESRLWPARLDNPEFREWMSAVHLVGEGGRPTALGRVFLGLVGREAVQFLLELEVSLSTGIDDELRAARRTLTALTTNDTLIYNDNLSEELWPSYPYAIMTHLRALGVVSREPNEDHTITHFSLSPDAADLVQAVISPAQNPYRALVSALLDAERGRLTTSVTGQPGPAGTDFAYARMIVHEIRNVTFPLTNALDRLWTELERGDGADMARVADLRLRVDRAMKRISDVTGEAARLAEAASEESFSLRAVVEEAIQATEVDRNGRIRVVIEALGDAGIEGPRNRWTLLFVNLLRNAAQARAGSGTVWVTTDWSSGGALHVFVDDDGPGIPAESRERIFGLGVSTRGGTGIGLHEARATVLQSGGSLSCEEAPAGGARFHIQVPARRRT